MRSATYEEMHKRFLDTGVPFVTVKFAQTLDGRIATATGDSKWISSAEARRYTHQLRSEHDAIMVGIGTVLADDPELTVRHVKGPDPLRIVIDTSLQIPITSRVLANGAGAHTLVVAGKAADKARQAAIEQLGAQVLRVAKRADRKGLDFARLLEALGRRGIESVLVEGGRRIITSLLASRSVDRLVAVIAPKIIGQGIDAVGDLGITRLEEAITFTSLKTRRFGPDIVVDARLK